MKNVNFVKKIILFVLTFLFFISTSPSLVNAQEAVEVLEGTVVNIIDQKIIIPKNSDEKQQYQKLKISITKGALKDHEIIVENGKFYTANQQVYKIGDRLVLSHHKDTEGKDIFFISDYVRRAPMFILFIVFMALAALIGKWRGIASLLGMVVSFLIIFLFILPQILKGNDPTVVAIIGSAFIIPATFYLSHGFNKKTTVAVVGTIISLIITGILASIFVEASKLTGFASEEAGFLQSTIQGEINIKGLLLAGIIVGVLGVLDDVTVSQSAIVTQLKIANPKLKIEELYRRAMDVGQDHISSMVNTLILVYTGAALPLLLLFVNSGRPFLEIINYEIIADEVVRTLVGSIGLILAVPITTFIAVLSLEKNKR